VRDAQGTKLLPIVDEATDYGADVRREDLHVESDGVPVQYRLLLPKGKGPFPTLFWIHGGPIGAFADGWHWRWNPLVFVSQGYAVVLPNPRGSTGFGFDYISGIWGNVWGDGCYRDLMKVADAVEARDDIGPMAAMGGSFGGYMSNWIGGNTTRFRCIVTHASIFSCWTFHGTTDHPAWWALEMQSTPYSDPEHHDRYSPQRFVQNWKSPTLVIHGEKDYRCPISEGIALFEALQLHRVESELLVFPDEGHWIMRPKNIVSWYTSIADFMGRYLR
jgi:dipeptidyl aminopeptidase/acylaminoacyl peptidase